MTTYAKNIPGGMASWAPWLRLWLATQLASLQTTCWLLHMLCLVFAFRNLMQL